MNLPQPVVDTFTYAWDNLDEPLELFTLQEWLTEANRKVYDIAEGVPVRPDLAPVLHQDKHQWS